MRKSNELYYDKSLPIISDREFDDLKKEIIDLEKRYPYLNNSKSPSNTVGFKPSKNFDKFKEKIKG